MRWAGEPRTREVLAGALPEELIACSAAGTNGYLTGTPFSVLGWDQ